MLHAVDAGRRGRTPGAPASFPFAFVADHRDARASSRSVRPDQRAGCAAARLPAAHSGRGPDAFFRRTKLSSARGRVARVRCPHLYRERACHWAAGSPPGYFSEPREAARAHLAAIGHHTPCARYQEFHDDRGAGEISKLGRKTATGILTRPHADASARLPRGSRARDTEALERRVAWPQAEADEAACEAPLDRDLQLGIAVAMPLPCQRVALTARTSPEGR